MKKVKNLKAFLGLILGLIVLNIAGSYVFSRFDLTSDKRYTLSETTKNILNNVQQPLFVEVFLEGTFPAEFRKLQSETKQLLEEFQAYNSNVSFLFVNPLENEEEMKQMAEYLFVNGMKPMNITVNDKGKQSQEMVFPWAVATSGEKQAKIQLLKNAMGASTEDKITSSVQHLEYAVAEAIHKVTTEKSKKVAVIKGIGELNDIFIADFLQTLRESYFIAPFTLDSVAVNPQKTLKDLQEYDLAIIAKPTKTFDENQIQVLDQFVMNGGASIWMLDNVRADMDSLRKSGEMLAYYEDQGLGEMLFKYGVRVNSDLVKDEVGSLIKLATGQHGSETVYENFIWKFAPYSIGLSDHPIVKNIDGVKFDFANSIDLLKNDIQKTVLLTSSPYAKKVGTPIVINLSQTVAEPPLDEKTFQQTEPIPLAVLLEGSFTSVYKNRVIPFKTDNYLNEGKPAKMIVISDGDIVKNQLDQQYQPMELGYDKWTNTLYGNKEFLMNAVNYLLDDSGLINLRTKEVKLALLNKEKVYSDYDRIRTVVVALPLAVLVVFGLLFTYLRKKKYRK